MTRLDSTSFDRHARYGYARELRASMGAARLRILDVGDPYGTLRSVFPEDDTFSLDLFAEGAHAGGRHAHVIGSGFLLPFAAGTFDMVTSHDVVEHLPPDGLTTFASELLRVSRGPVVIVAPFDDPRTRHCEDIIRGYYRTRAGAGLRPLEEHAEGAGLPDARDFTRWLDAEGITWDCYSGGWLAHWLAMMSLKAHFAATGDIIADRSFDAAFIDGLSQVDDRAPHYRRAFVLRPPSVLARPRARWDELPSQIEAERLALGDLAWLLTSALRPGETPVARDSAWLAQLAADSALTGTFPDLADSLRILAARVATVFPDDPTDILPLTAVVVATDGLATVEAALERLVPQVDAVGGETVVVVPEPSDPALDAALPPGCRAVVETADDWLVRLNRGVADARGRVLLFVDPDLVLPDSFVSDLLDAYRPGSGITCVGAPIEDGGASPLRRALRPDGEDVLYAPRQAMVIGRSHYSGLGGFDGSMGGVLDDVELGMRLRRRGERVVQAGKPCHWRTPQPAWAPELAGAEAASVLRTLFVTTPPGSTMARLGPELAAAVGAGHDDPWINAVADAMGPEPVTGSPAAGHTSLAVDLLQRRATVLAPSTDADDGDLDSRFGGLHVAHLDPARQASSPTGIVIVGTGPRSLALLHAFGTAGRAPVRTVPGSGLAAALDDAAPPALVIASEEAYVADPAVFAGAARLVLDASGGGADRSSPLRSADAVLCAAEAQRPGIAAALATLGRAAPPVVAISTLPEPTALVRTYRRRPGGHRGVEDIPAGAVVIDGRGNPDDLEGFTLAIGNRLGSLPDRPASVVLVDAGMGAGTIAGTPRTADPMVLAGAPLAVVLGRGDWLLEALAWEVPAVVASGDPWAALIPHYSAGAVTDDLSATVDAVTILVTSPVLLARASAGAALAGAQSLSAATSALRDAFGDLLDGVPEGVRAPRRDAP